MPQEKTASRAGWVLSIAAVVIGLALAGGGYWFYCHQAYAIRNREYQELKAIADLKTGQLLSWRFERLADARMNATGTARTLFLKWLSTPADPAIQSALLLRMRLYADLEGYENMMIAGLDGNLLFSLDSRLLELDPQTKQLVSAAVSSGSAVFGDFSRCAACGEVHLDTAAPIVDEAKRPVGVLIQRVNPEQYLYPLIQTWPTPSKSAETLLVRREGDSVLFLNKLRHRGDLPLSIRIPLTATEVPAIQAVSGQQGEFSGLDYRKIRVLADIRPVPDTPWFLVTKIDENEIQAQTRFVGLGILALVGLGILMTVAIVVNIFYYRQRNLYQVLFRSERQRREAQEEIRATLYGIGDGVMATDAQGRITRMNPVAEQLTGWLEAEALGQPLLQVFHIINEETRDKVENPVDRVLRDGMIVGLANHTLLINRAGIELPVADSGAPIRNEAGETIGAVLVFRDQTEERAVLERLRESEERYRILFEGSSQGILVADLKTRRFLYANPAICRMFGYAAAEMIGLGVEDIHPAESLEQVLAEFAAQAAGDQPHALAIPCLKKDNSIFRADISATPMVINGRPCSVGFFHDTTERQKLEEQLRQAQKMEAVGQLAGGVAHDFNNMLMVILGHADIALSRIDADQPLFANLQEIRKAAQRSADITRQLLSFARKQTVMPMVLDLNEAVAGMLKMLHRLIGEDIALVFKPGSNLWPIKIDPVQVDQILANLSVNARDAIADNGEITIETENVVLDKSYAATHVEFMPGAYVLLAVSDNGSGMDGQTRNHLFEPFFTTKELGKGTGLGLATVYGIVKQNKGFINVYSEPGQGTTFKIYLPRVQRVAADETPAEPQKPILGNETILLVEDEEAILNLGKSILKQCGYTVLAARTPDEALDMATSHAGTIHLLVTDVVLPGLNGRELKERLAAQRTGLKVLYMSGYMADVIAQHGVLDQGISFLQKPFSVMTLAEKVREVLDDRGGQ